MYPRQPHQFRAIPLLARRVILSDGASHARLFTSGNLASLPKSGRGLLIGRLVCIDWTPVAANLRETPELCDVTWKAQSNRPIKCDPCVPRQRWQLEKMVGPRHPPSEQAADRESQQPTGPIAIP